MSIKRLFGLQCDFRRWVAIQATMASLIIGWMFGSARGEDIRLPGLKSSVEVYLDGYEIPHIYADDWTDAARVVGYLHASERLWQMDMLRRQASGNLSEIIGPDGLPADTLMRQLGIRRTCEELWNSNLIPAEMRAELESYAAGVNYKIGQLDKQQLPLGFQALEYQPQPWTPVDSLVFSKYMGWDQSGTMDDLWLGSIVEKMGAVALEQLWPIDRPYEQSTITAQSNRSQALKALNQISATESLKVFEQLASVSPTAIQLSNQNHQNESPTDPTFGHRGLMGEPLGDMSESYLNLFERLSNVPWFGRGSSFGSNNWAVDGTKTKSGKPIVCSDPHLGFKIPSIWYTAHFSVGGKNVAGVTFPGSPTVVIGHNDSVAWGLTNMQADAVDFYLEKIDPQNPSRYQHRGQWQPVTRLVEKIPVRGAQPHELIIETTVHGPIVSRQPQAISLCWTGLGPTTDSIAFWEIHRANNLSDFLAGLDKLEVPAMNIVYGDVNGNIAMHCCGRLPVRARGQGRIPMDGASGDYDWTGWIPRDQLPLSINPSEHFVASANGRPHPLGFPHYLGWMWDPSYRTRRIKSLLGEAASLTVETMKPIQFDHFDGAASNFLPAMLSALKDPLEGQASRPELVTALEALRKWDYVASPEALGPAIWLRWLEKYRDSVWADEWGEYGIDKKEGSWGFCGDNRREPTLEVLEFLTREMPNSPWFDDRSTPAREDRDAMLKRSFVETIDSLTSQFGADQSRWAWKNINVLKVDSLSGQPELSVEGGPVVGTAFTLNPGGNVGHVGSGASWRMIVDFGHPDQSVGVYPGGQSESPTSTHYADQIPLWASGDYAQLNMVGSPEALPESAKRRVLKFK